MSDEKIHLFPLLICAKNHNDVFRTVEVHDRSKLKSCLLTYNEPDRNLDSRVLILYNDLMDQLKSIFLLLDNTRPNSFGSSNFFDFSWLEAYCNRDVNTIKLNID